VVVKNHGSRSASTFPFELVLEGDLFVELHTNPVLGLVRRFIGKLPGSKHMGWRFNIRSKFDEDVARAAWYKAHKQDPLPEDDLQLGEIPLLGLHDGSASWIAAQTG
jgi:hypothetical protein